jgi:hypothetical protein
MYGVVEELIWTTEKGAMLLVEGRRGFRCGGVSESKGMKKGRGLEDSA